MTVALVLASAGLVVDATTRSLRRSLADSMPAAASIATPAVLLPDTPITVTVAAAGQYAPWTTTAERLLTAPEMWRRMHLANWNGVPPQWREPALAAMLDRYRAELHLPERWGTMSAAEWDLIPQPARTVAYRRMLAYWGAWYEIGAEYGLSPARVADTLAAIAMAESWFDHRAVQVNTRGDRDLGLAQASEGARMRMRRWYRAGFVAMAPDDDEYLNPWTASHFMAIWLQRLLTQTDGDLDRAVRAYHRGLSRADDEAGWRYLDMVTQRRVRFIHNNAAPEAWDYVWRLSSASALPSACCNASARAVTPPKATSRTPSPSGSMALSDAEGLADTAPPNPTRVRSR